MDYEPGWYAARFVARSEEIVMLRIPQILQAEPHCCGDAAIEIVLKYHGFDKYRVRLATRTDGTDPRAIEDHLRRYGLRVLSGEMDIDDLRRFTETWRPVICLVTWPGDGESHYVIPTSVSGRSVRVWDVETGERRVSVPDWLAAWHAKDGRNSLPFRSWAIAAWVPE